MLFKFLPIFEKTIVILLGLMMALVISISTIELGWIIVKSIMMSPKFLLDITKLLDLFGLFLLILIGIELLESIKVYVTERAFRVETVLLVGIIAIARKVIVLDIKQFSELPLIGVGVITITLAAGYYLIKQTHKDSKSRPL